MKLCALILCLALAVSAQPEFLLDPPASYDYDYLVVGAGASGSVVAERITENPHLAALLISNGGDARGTPGNQAEICAPNPALFRATWVQNVIPAVTQDPAPGNVQQWYAWLSKNDGGASSSTDDGVAVFSDNSYFDAVNQVAQQAGGDADWSSEAFRQLRIKMETYHPGQGFPDDPHWHGSSGPMDFTTWPQEPYSQALSQAFSQVVGVPVLPDNNIGISLGVGVNARAILSKPDGSFVRSAPFEQYIRGLANWSPSGQGKRANLDVWEYTTVSKILFCKGSGRNSQPKACGVAYTNTATGESGRVFARREVIVSAGAYNSPVLLQVSGYGPADLLAQFQPAGAVKQVVHNPNVGKYAFTAMTINTIWLVDAPGTVRSGCQTVNGYWQSARSLAAGETRTDVGAGWGMFGQYPCPSNPEALCPLVLAPVLQYSSGSGPVGTINATSLGCLRSC